MTVELAVSATEPGCLRTIAAALDRAGPGDVVAVRPGTYREALEPHGDVRVVATGGAGTVIVTAVEGSAVTVTRGEVVLEGLVLRGAPGCDALVQVGGGLLLLRDVDVDADGWAGVQVTGGRLEAAGGRLANRSGAALVVEGGTGAELTDVNIGPASTAGVVVTSPVGVSLRRSNVRPGGRHGVVVAGDGVARLDTCVIGEASVAGVLVHERAAAELTDCHLEGPGDGVRADGTARAFLLRATLAGLGGDGLVAGGEAELVATDCGLWDLRGRGVAASDRSGVTLTSVHVARTAAAALTVRGAARVAASDLAVDDAGSAGLEVVGRAELSVDDLRVDGGVTGVLVAGLGRLRLRGVRVRRAEVALAVGGGDVRVQDLEAQDCGTGVRLDRSARAVVDSGLFHRCGTGVHVHGEAEAVLRSVTVEDSGTTGVTVDSGAVLAARRCRVARSQSDGVRLLPGATATVTECELVANQGAGLAVLTTADVLLSGGSIHGNRGDDVLAPPGHHLVVDGTRLGDGARRI